MKANNSKLTFFFTLTGLILLFYSGYLYYIQKELRDFNPIQCKIISAELKKTDSFFQPEIQYQFQLNGNTYQSSNYSLQKKNYTQAEVFQIVSHYKTGNSSVCFYQISNPQISILKKSSNFSLIIFCLVCGFGILILEYRYWKWNKPKPASVSLIIFFLFFIHLPLFSLDKVVLQLRWDHQAQFAGYYAAQLKGYYKEAGISVEIRSCILKDQKRLCVIDEVSEGRAHFGIGSIDILDGYLKGKPLILLKSIFQKSSAAFFYRKGVFNNLSDLPNLRISRNKNDLIDLEFQSILKSEGIDIEKLSFLPHPSEIFPFLRNEIDLFPGYDISLPFYTQKMDPEILSFKAENFGIDFYGDSLFTNSNFLLENPDLINRFSNASMKGWKYAMEHSSEIASHISKYYPQNVNASSKNITDFNLFQIESIKRLTLYPLVKMGNINPHRWEMIFSHLQKIGFVDSQIKFNVSDFIYDFEKVKSIQVESKLFFRTIVLLISLFFISLLAMFLKKVSSLYSKKEKSFQTVVNTISDIVWLTDENFRLLFISPSCEKISSYTQNEILESNFEIFLTEDSLSELLSIYEFLNNHRKNILLSPQLITLKGTSKNQCSLYLETKISPVYDEKNHFCGIVGCMRDKTLEFSDLLLKSQYEAQLKINETNEIAGILARSVAHDFNNILSPLNLLVDLIELKSESDPEIQENCSKIFVLLSKAADLVKQVNKSHIEREKAKQTPPLMIFEELRKILLLLCPENICFDFQMEECSVLIHCAPIHLQQIVLNLFKNSIQAIDSKQGTISLTVKPVNWENQENFIEISVKDNGPGFDENFTKKIFEPNFTTKKEGSGIGLNIVNSLIQKYNWTLQVKSEKGKGSEFKILIPGIQEHNEPLRFTDKTKILLIDDEELFLRNIKKILEKNSFNVSAFGDSFSALDTFCKQPENFDLIIADYRIPGLNGIDLISQIQKIRKEIPYLIITGYQESLSKIINPRYILSKPFTQKQLMDKINLLFHPLNHFPLINPE